MALVIQNLAMTPSYVPYERPPQPITLWSAIPRGLQSFIVRTQQIDIKPVNDDFQLNLTALLSPNFGYVMADANFSFAGARAVDWEAECNLNLQFFYRANQTLSFGLAGNWRQSMLISSLFTDSRAMVIDHPFPSFPMIGSEGSTGIQIVLSAWNGNNTAAPIGVVNAFLSFWEFDLEQVRKYPINSPIPTHAR